MAENQRPRDEFPIFVDRWLPNQGDLNGIEGLKDTLISHRMFRNNEILDNLIYADLLEQEWFWFALYDSGLFEVLRIFNIERTDIAQIKALINYNYNPSRKNIALFFNEILGEGNYFLEELAGEINVNISQIPDIINNRIVLEIAESNNLIAVETLENANRVEFVKAETILNEKFNFLYAVYVAAGVKFNINIEINLMKKLKKGVKNHGR